MAEVVIDISAAAVERMPSKPYVVDNTVAPVGEMREEDRIRLSWEQEQRRKSA